jgi:hypothetical protein
MTWEESWFASAWGQQSERQSRFGLLVAVSQDERSDEVRDSMYELWSLMDGRGDERRPRVRTSAMGGHLESKSVV